MDKPEDLKEAELRAYARGYSAGKRRKTATRSRENLIAHEQAIMDRIYIALLPAAMQVDGWTIGEEKITTGAQRCKLANHWAMQAYENRPIVRGK